MGLRYKKTKRLERAADLPDEVLYSKGQESIRHDHFDEQIIIDKINKKMDKASTKLSS